MATGKVYYWIKLKDSFMTSDKVDFLMSQKDGANYIVLYQMLCLKCMNTSGVMAKQIGEILLPFDTEKIVRDCKYFSKDTVIVALELFKKLGMVYQQEDGILKIVDFENMVGSETDYAQQKRLQREKAKYIQLSEKYGQEIDSPMDNVHTEIRDKRLEIRDKRIDIDKDKESKKENTHTLFQRLLPDYIFSDLLTAKITEWIKYKVERKEGYKEQGMKSLLRQLENKAMQHGEEAICNLIDECMANNWKGIIFDRLSKQQKTADQKGRLDWIDEI